MRNEHYTPFTGNRIETPSSTQVVRRFLKPGHVAELRERKITQFHAIEWLLFIDGSMIESRMYHGARVSLYGGELEQRCAALRERGYVEDHSASQVAQ